MAPRAASSRRLTSRSLLSPASPQTHVWPLGLLLFVDTLSPHLCISTHEWTDTVNTISCILPPLPRISTHEWLCSRCAYTYLLRIGGGQIKGAADASLSIKYTWLLVATTPHPCASSFSSFIRHAWCSPLSCDFVACEGLLRFCNPLKRRWLKAFRVFMMALRDVKGAHLVYAYCVVSLTFLSRGGEVCAEFKIL
jgi:hypothetical protein